MHDTSKAGRGWGQMTKNKSLEKLAGADAKNRLSDQWKTTASIKFEPRIPSGTIRGSWWRGMLIDDTWNLIGKPTDRAAVGRTPPTSNAYYFGAPERNWFFRQLILRLPAFDVNAY